MNPTPPARPPVVEFDARLLPLDAFAYAPDEPPLPSSWTITHGLGGPAANTYSEVRFGPAVAETLDALTDDEHVRERVLDEVVRRVAVALYGTAWAFHYRPDQYADAIDRHRMTRREVVVVEGIEVYS